MSDDVPLPVFRAVLFERVLKGVQHSGVGLRRARVMDEDLKVLLVERGNRAIELVLGPRRQNLDGIESEVRPSAISSTARNELRHLLLTTLIVRPLSRAVVEGDLAFIAQLLQRCVQTVGFVIRRYQYSGDATR